MAEQLRLRLVYDRAGPRSDGRPAFASGALSDHPGIDGAGLVRLWPGEDVAVGRSSLCALVVDAPLAGQRHCMIRVSPTGEPELWASGHGARSPRHNGATFVGCVPIAPGDRIDLLTEDDELVAAFVVERDTSPPARPDRAGPASSPYRDPPPVLELTVHAPDPGASTSFTVDLRGNASVRRGAMLRRAAVPPELWAAFERLLAADRLDALGPAAGRGAAVASLTLRGATVVFHGQAGGGSDPHDWPGLPPGAAAILAPLLRLVALAERGMPGDDVAALLCDLPRAPTPITVSGPLGRLLVRYNVHSTFISTKAERGAFLKLWSSGKVELREGASDLEDGEASGVDLVDIGPDRAAAIARALAGAGFGAGAPSAGYVHRFELYDDSGLPRRTSVTFDAERGMASGAAFDAETQLLLEELGSLFADALAARLRSGARRR